MKKNAKARTAIRDLSNALSDNQLQQVPGGLMRLRFGPVASLNGTCVGTTYPGSVVNPGEVDTVTDEKYDIDGASATSCVSTTSCSACHRPSPVWTSSGTMPASSSS